MGGSPGPAAAAVADRESPELVGLGFPEPVVEPAEDGAVEGRDDAHDGPPAGAVAAQPTGRPGSTRPALGREDPRRQDRALRRSGRPTPPGAGPPARPRSAPTHACRPSSRASGGGRRPVTRSRRRESVRRRRANVLFVLGLISACALFLAATTKTDALYYVFGATFGVMCVLRLRARTASPA